MDFISIPATRFAGSQPKIRHRQVVPDPQSGKHEIVANRIVRDPSCESRGYLDCGGQVAGLPASEAQTKRDTVHVNIQGNDQAGKGNPVPATGVDIIRPNHPPQKKIDAFAGASPAGERDEMTGGSNGRKSSTKTVQCRNDGSIRGVKTLHEGSVEGSISVDHRLGAHEQVANMVTGGKAMPETAETIVEGSRVGICQEHGRRRSHDRQDPVHASQDLGNAAIGKGCSDEPDDFAISDGFIFVQEFQWVGMNELATVNGLIKRFELYGKFKIFGVHDGLLGVITAYRHSIWGHFNQHSC